MDSESACLANCELFGKHARYFESHVVPVWTQVYDSLVRRAGISRGSRVLDAGTGTGEVALRAGRLVGKRGFVLGIDMEEGMLRIARNKAGERGLGNVRFSRMSIEKLELPEGSFDTVVGNYSLCCCFDYEAAVAECFRVLKAGGRLTYNHSGPGDSPEFGRASEIFEKYQTRKPTKRLALVREANASQDAAVEKYLDPFVTLDLLRRIGFLDAEATVTRRVLTYDNPDAYIERMLSFNWRNEASEISPADLREFKSEARRALGMMSGGPRFVVSDDMIYFSGSKPSG